MDKTIRIIYLYLFSFVGLLITVIGCVRLVDLGLKTFIFTQADSNPVYYNAPRVMPLDKSGSASAEPSQEEIARQQRYEEQNTKRNQHRELASSLAMIIVGIPLYTYHWKIIQKKS